MATPAASADAVETSIEAIFAAWPEPVRNEIEQFGLASASISIPISRLEQGMKSGRVVFTWAELCGWLSTPMPGSVNGESQVELPLNVIAPLFMAKRRAAAPRKVLSVGENVPNLFAGAVRPAEPPAPIAPEAPAAPEAAPAPPTPAAPNVLGLIFGQPAKTAWSPHDIVEHVQKLTGVASALLSSTDGLLVAGVMPVPMRAETMAAFVPQMFTRVGVAAEETHLGTLCGLKVTTGQATCAIYKAGALYLAVLGQPGQMLPEASLERIAGALSQPQH